MIEKKIKNLFYDKKKDENELFYANEKTIDNIIIKKENEINKIKNQLLIKENPLSTFTIRKYEQPLKLKPRDLIKRFILSIGMLSPGESRDVIVDILYVMLQIKKRKKNLTSKEITNKVIINRKKHKLEMQGIAESNIRRQIKRLRDIFIIEKIKNEYRITENMPIEQIFHGKIKPYLLNEILMRVSDYTKEVDKI